MEFIWVSLPHRIGLRFRRDSVIRLEEKRMDRYRILTLDGGGAWALIEVMALIDLYGADTTGHQVLRDFDMVAANSGGSIVLGGLVEDLTLQKMLDFFQSEDKRKSIFVRKSLHLPGLEKYVTTEKLSGLRNAFPNRCDIPLHEVAKDIPGRNSGKPVHLLIAGFNYDRSRGEFFRSADATRPGWGIGDPSTYSLAECIHASSNAPIRYFDRPAEFLTQPGKHYWDGAISGSNNPILIAVTEALVLGQAPLNLAALSIGTGGTFLPFAPDGADPEPYYQVIHPSSLTTDLEKIAGAILDDPPDVASFMAHVMSGGPPAAAVAPVDSSIVRMNPMIAPVLNEEDQFVLPHGMDDESFENLVKLDMDAVEQEQVDEIVNFARLWLKGSISNQPVRAAVDLTPEIGQGKYALAKAAWLQLTQTP
jgi:hypothetical protein